MAIAFVVGASAGGANSGSGVDTTGANLLIGSNGSFGSLPGSGDISDNKSNSYTFVDVVNNLFGVNAVDLYYNVGGTVGSGHVWNSSAGSFNTTGGAAFSGVATSGTLNGSDVTGQDSTNVSTGLTLGPITPSAPGCLLVATFSAYGNGSASMALDSASIAAGWQVATYTFASVGLLVAYLIQTSAVPASCTCSVTAGLVSGIMQAFNAAGGSPDVTVALTGVSGTSAVGTLTPNIAIPLTGVSGSSAVGTVSAGGDKSFALTGVAATGSAGTVGVSDSIPITGVAAAAAVGTVGRDQLVTILLTGVAATGQVGDVTASGDKSVAITGVQAAGSVGTIGVQGADNFGDSHDPGIRKYLGDLEKRRKKRWEEEAEAKKRHREQTIAAFEKIAEEKPEVAREIAQPFLPKKPKYLRQQYELPKQTIFKIAADVEAAARIWEAYIEMDDEEVLRYL